MSEKYMPSPDESAEIKKNLNASRYRMGFAQLFFSGEESTLGGLKVMMIKMLGGNDMHLAISGSFGGLVHFLQALSVPLLQIFKSNKKAMAAALAIGVGGGTLLALTVLGGATGRMTGFFLWTFIIGIFIMATATGIQTAVENNWIGDLLPVNCLGWFSSVKSIISLVGMSVFAAMFGFIVDNFGNLTAAGVGIFVIVALSHVLAITLIWQIPDREPKIKPLFRKGKLTGMNIKSPALWFYIAFYLLWTGGRSLFNTFVTIFLITEFKFGLLKINGLLIMGQVISCFMLWILGKVSDKKGNRKLLAMLSFIVGMSMFLYLLTPFLGLIPVFAVYIISGMAGLTHGMLVVNYSLEIIPEVGRATYNSFIRVVLGIWTIVVINIGGVCARMLEKSNFSFEIFGKSYSRYHIMFAIGALMATSCVIPLLLAGNRKIENIEDK